MDKKLAPNQNYQVTSVPLNGGLDFVSPPSMVEPGTLTDCLNYEVVDRNGYRRIDGFYKWDNAFTLESDQEHYVDATETIAGSSEVGDYLITQNNYDGDGGPFGIISEIEVLTGSNRRIYYFRINSAVEPIVGDTILSVKNATTTTWDTTSAPTKAARHTVLSIDSNPDLGPGARLVKYKDQETQAYPTTQGGGPAILGLKHFNNTAYAIMDAVTLQLTSSAPLYAGDVVGDSQQTYILLNPRLVSGTTWLSDGMYLESRKLSNTATPSRARPFGPEETLSFGLARLATSPVSALSILDEDTNRPSIALLYKSNRVKDYYLDTAREVGNINTAGVGAGYSSPPIVSITGGGGFGAKAVAILGLGAVDTIAVTSAGNKYSSQPTVSLTGGSPATPETATLYPRGWDWTGWRAVNTGWKFGTQAVKSASGFLTKVDRTKGPTSQTAAYTTGSISGKPFAVLNSLDFTGANNTGNARPGPSTGLIWDPTFVHATGGGSYNTLFREVDLFGDTRSHTLGFAAIDNINENIPKGSVITGVELSIDYTTPTGTAPSGSQVRNYKGRACLFKTTDVSVGFTDRTETRLGDFREADIPLSTSSGTLVIGGDNDIWNTDGLTIDDFTQNVGVAFDIGLTVAASGGLDFSFGIDNVRLKLYYRSPNITYYFASGTATERNVMSATLVNYSRRSGDLLAQDWAGDWQVADLGVEKYCAAGSVGLVKITNGGSGYTSAPTVSFADPSTGGESGAAGTAVISNGKVVGVVMTNGGTGYTSATTVSFSGGGGSGAAATAIVGAIPGIQSGMGIYADAALSSRIGFVSEDMSYNGLDSYTALETEQSRYEIVAANFYADESWEGIYGVSGAGRAWYFDGNYFSRIYAIPLDQDDSAEKDKPRHICNYRYHLALGYRSGTVLFSVIGEPEDFDGQLGAGQIGVGDPVTGILPLPGQYLAVFCENSIWGVTGKIVEEFSLENISPYSGAIEYSVVAIGSKPIFCDTMGISTLEQSDKYGNFLGNRLSHKISPWLLPRLSVAGRGYADGNTSGLIAAFPVRSKNQYRLWFRDGAQLVMSFVGPENEPQFTLSRYLLAGYQGFGDEGDIADNYTTQALSNATDKLVLLAVTSDVDSQGKEVILFSADLVKSRNTAGATATYLPNYVFRADYTNQFNDYLLTDGENPLIVRPLGIPAYVDTAFSTVENPFARKSIRKVRVEGTTRGVASVSIITEKNYSVPDFAGNVIVSCPLNRVDQLPWNDQANFKATSNIANVAETDRVVLIRLAGLTTEKKKILDGSSMGFFSKYYTTKTPEPGDGRVHYCEPPHYLQLLLIQYEEGRQDA